MVATMASDLSNTEDAAADLATEWGRRMRSIRRDKELTATALADEVGISRPYLHRLEAGQYVPSDGIRIKIAAALGVQVDEIFTYDLREVSS